MRSPPQAALPMQFTGLGSMMNVHMCAGPIRNYAEAALGGGQLRDLLYFDLLERGIWCARRGMFNLSLPMQDADCELLVDAIRDFLCQPRAAVRRHLSCARSRMSPP